MTLTACKKHKIDCVSIRIRDNSPYGGQQVAEIRVDARVAGTEVSSYTGGFVLSDAALSLIGQARELVRDETA